MNTMNLTATLTATLINPTGLHKIAMALEKPGSTCLICFTDESIRFIWCPPQNIGKRIWIDVDPNDLFSQYCVKTEDNNQVNLSVDLDSFVHAATSAQQTETTQIELCQQMVNGRPRILLVWRMEMESRTGTRYEQLGFEVDRLSNGQIERFWEPPDLEDNQKSISFPIHGILPLVNELKSSFKYVTVAANMNGELKLLVERDTMHGKYVFNNLINTGIGELEIAEEQERLRFAIVRILTEDLASFLECHHIEPDRIVCVIKHQSSLTLYVFFNLDDNDDKDETELICDIPVYLF